MLLAWGSQKQHKHNSTHKSNFWKCLTDEWWPVTLPWSVVAQREPRRSMEACKGKVFQETQTLPFAAAMLLWLQSHQSRVSRDNWAPIISQGVPMIPLARHSL